MNSRSIRALVQVSSCSHPHSRQRTTAGVGTARAPPARTWEVSLLRCWSSRTRKRNSGAAATSSKPPPPAQRVGCGIMLRKATGRCALSASPSGVELMEDGVLTIVSDAKRRYPQNGWVPNRRASEAAGTKRDITAQMSLEGTLTAVIL